MAKKPVKKLSSTPAKSSFSEFDRVFENFRNDLEKSFSSFPRIDFSSFPKLSQTGCDVIDCNDYPDWLMAVRSDWIMTFAKTISFSCLMIEVKLCNV